VIKFRPICVLDIGWKVLKKIMLNRINHHVYSKGYMNENQLGFRPQKSTISAVLTTRNFVKQGLADGEVIALVRLDVQGAFDATWWPGILKVLRACKCPKNIYEHAKSYFTQRSAVLSTNTLGSEKGISRGWLRVRDVVQASGT
jgi:hypothetical protein